MVLPNGSRAEKEIETVKVRPFERRHVHLRRDVAREYPAKRLVKRHRFFVKHVQPQCRVKPTMGFVAINHVQELRLSMCVGYDHGFVVFGNESRYKI